MTTNAELDALVMAHDRKGLFVLFRDLTTECRKDMLVARLLGAGEASTIYGKPGDGKSVLAEDLGLHVAAGWEWHGRPVRRGAVVYVALERRKLVERRAIAFRKRHGIADLPFAIVGGVYDFRDRRTAQTIAEICRQVEEATGEPVVLIIIDTISRALAGGDENSPKDMGAIVAATSILQQATGAHVMWVHHVPQDAAERMRGHGALLGAMDTTIQVAKGEAVRTATVVKANDSAEGEAVAFTLESVVIGTDDSGDTTAPVVIPTEALSVHRRAATTRKLSDTQKRALTSLAEAVLETGKPAPGSLNLPAGIMAVEIEAWRNRMLADGVLDRDAKNPRADFKRIRESLASRSLIGIHYGAQEGIAWRA